MSALESTEEAMDRRGDDAWDELKTNPDWLKWLAIGEAMMHARTACMYETGSNRPLGRGYNEAFSRWLAKRKFGKMDGGDRSRLFECMENRVAIEAWRATLTATERLRLNHPSTMLRKWKSSNKVPDITKQQKPSSNAQLKEAHATVLEENHKLKKQIERGGGSLFDLNLSTPEEIGEVVAAHTSADKANKIADEIRAAVKRRRQKPAG